MNSTSPLVLVGFGIVVALIIAARPSPAWRQNVFLAASLVFVASLSRNPLAFLPLLGFLLAGHLAMRATANASLRTLALTIAGIVLLFVWLKRYPIIPSGLRLPYSYVTIGLSYVLFRLLHLIIEGHDDAAIARLSLGDYLRYVVGFTTLVAGPIMFYDEYAAEQHAMANGVTLADVGAGVERIIVGLFKASAVAALLASIRADAVASFRAGGSVATQSMAGAAVFGLYPLFLYCNFSGYIDIVIGISRLMGQRLPENFDRPFAATSVIDFWNRWHITLSRWLKRYVFNPLLIALLRRFNARSAEPFLATLAFFVTFSLVGVWHGQTTAFLFFGFLTGLGVSANKLHQVLMARMLGRKPYASLAKHPMYRIAARGLNFTWFAFTLTWFWASWNVASQLWAMTGRKRWALVWLGIFLVSSSMLALWEALHARWESLESVRISPLALLRVRTAWLTTLAVIAAAVVAISVQAAPELVYRDF